MVRKSIKIAFMYLHNQNVGKDLIVLNPCKDGLATPRLVNRPHLHGFNIIILKLCDQISYHVLYISFEDSLAPDVHLMCT